MSRLVIVRCGKKKIWDGNPSAGPTRAKDAYTSPASQTYMRYADQLSDEWIILSAKYGFIDPDFVIPCNYNVTFENKSTNPLSIQELKQQVRDKRLGQFNEIEVLGGKCYAYHVQQAFSETKAKVLKPFEGIKGNGSMSQKVNQALRDGKPMT